MADESHVNDIGTAFKLVIVDTADEVIPIGLATELLVNFRRPDYTSFSRVGSFLTTGADGTIKYVTLDGDLDQQGPWSVQAVVTLPEGKWSSKIGSFEVKGNIDVL